MTDTLLGAGSLWIWILIALALVAVLVLIILSSVVRGGTKPKAEAPGAPGGPEEVPAAPVVTGSAQPAADSFARATRFLRRAVAGRDYRYRIPWYLVIGDPESGKTSLMSAAGPDLGAHEGLSGPHKALDWHFHDQGILVGVAGRYFKSGSGGQDWERLLRLLQNFRPRRPLDGVVLTIAASDLLGPVALDETQLGARATHFSEMLSKAQRSLGFSFPVYVVVTRCDEISGFGPFCRELPARSSSDIIGWSNPYNLDASFSADWVHEAFDGIALDLQRLQSEIFVERTEVRSPGDVFLFPEEFSRMRSPLHVYLDRLFRETAYREGFRFRGLYFTGDISEYASGVTELEAAPVMEDAGEVWPPQIVPPPRPRPVFAPRKTPAYVQTLFEQKIFAENAVARPLSRVHLARSRAVSYIQMAAAALMLILALGTWLGYRHLASDRELLRPALLTMYRRTQAPHVAGAGQQDSDANQSDARFGNLLLHSLSNASDVSFHSTFVPASWFASTNDDVTAVMRYAGEHWILSALRDYLMDRKRQLLTQRVPAPAPAAAEAPSGEGKPAEAASDAAADVPLVLSLEGTTEFHDLERFVNELRGLSDAIGNYESLRRQGHLEDVERIRKLLEYLKVEGVRPSGHLSQALRSASAEPVPITREEVEVAAAFMKELIGRLFEDWFQNNSVANDIEQLRDAVVELERASGRGAVYTDQNLKDLLALLSQADNDFSNPNFAWLSKPTLDPVTPLLRITANPLDAANSTVQAYARQTGESYLAQLRRNLREQRTGMTGFLVDTKDPLALSDGAKQLHLALENTLRLPFMADGSDDLHEIRTTITDTSHLMWRLEPIQQALRLDDIYAQFARDGLRGASPQLSTVVRRIGLEQLRHKVRDLVGQSQNFQTAALSLGAAADDETLPEVNSFREAAAPLMDLSTRFQALGATEISTSISRVLVAQSYHLLTVLDRRLRDDRLYAAKEGAWRGTGSLAFAAFGVAGTPALTEFLTAQRDRARFLEQQSEPLIAFLSKQLTVRNEEQNRVISKWQRIIDDFHQFDAKKVDANITVLEDFITTGADKIIPDNFCGENLPDAQDARQDYFIQIRTGLRTSFTERCRDVSTEGVCDSYASIADLFNGKLAGKFPFAAYTGEKSQPEAAPEDITEFYQVFDRNQKRARATLKETTRLGPLGTQALGFLDMVDQLRPFAVAAADAEKDLPFTFDVVPRFRVNQVNESGANQIIDWTLQVGGQIFRQREPEHAGRWRSGNPIRLSMRWANDSLEMPVHDASQSHLIIRDRNAYFEFTGRWALLALLRSQQSAPAEIAQAMENQPYILKFKIKTERDPKWAGAETAAPLGQATVFLQARILAPNAKTPLVLPAFPVSAPRVDSLCGRR